MTAKKSIALLIALAMAVAMLAGCSSGTPTDANDPASAGDGSAAAICSSENARDLLAAADGGGDLHRGPVD